MKKRNTVFFGYVHFDKSDKIIDDIKEFIDDESNINSEAQLELNEGSSLLQYQIYTDIIDWQFSDESGNKVEMEDALTEEGQYRVYFSRIIESDFQGDDYRLEDWATMDDCFIEDDSVCEHNNTITNECSDCNEQERN